MLFFVVNYFLCRCYFAVVVGAVDGQEAEDDDEVEVVNDDDDHIHADNRTSVTYKPRICECSNS